MKQRLDRTMVISRLLKSQMGVTDCYECLLGIIYTVAMIKEKIKL